MNYTKIKKLISKLVSNSIAKRDNSPDAISVPPVITSIHETLARINAMPTIDDAMKVYASRLVDVYLSATAGNYSACIGAAEEVAQRLGRSVESINTEIASQVEACLIDIEHGAVFKDNLSEAFLSCLLDFEQRLESRAAI